MSKVWLLLALLFFENDRAFFARGFLLPAEEALATFRFLPRFDEDRFRVAVLVDARLFFVVAADCFVFDAVVEIQPLPPVDCRDDLALATLWGTRMNKLGWSDITKDCALRVQTR